MHGDEQAAPELLLCGEGSVFEARFAFTDPLLRCVWSQPGAAHPHRLRDRIQVQPARATQSAAAAAVRVLRRSGKTEVRR
jgi:hypothetical protein